MSEHDLSHHALSNTCRLSLYDTTPNLQPGAYEWRIAAHKLLLQLSERRFTDFVYSLPNIVFITGMHHSLQEGMHHSCVAVVSAVSTATHNRQWNIDCNNPDYTSGIVSVVLSDRARLTSFFYPSDLGETVITCATGKVIPIESLVTATTMGQNRDKLFLV